MPFAACRLQMVEGPAAGGVDVIVTALPPAIRTFRDPSNEIIAYRDRCGSLAGVAWIGPSRPDHPPDRYCRGPGHPRSLAGPHLCRAYRILGGLRQAVRHRRK